MTTTLINRHCIKQKNYGRAAQARQRCCNPNNKLYKYYGARGVLFNFAGIQEMTEYLSTLPGNDDPNLWLDRINNNGHYEAGNLRFISPSESAKNRSNHQTIAPPTEQITQRAKWQRAPRSPKPLYQESPMVTFIHDDWLRLSKEQEDHRQAALEARTTKQQLFLAWLRDHPHHLAKLRTVSMREAAAEIGTTHSYIARFEQGDIGGISDEALNRIFDYYRRLENGR